jgi:prepilin-type N-terminal cleavage/methylation domain-containing protein
MTLRSNSFSMKQAGFAARVSPRTSDAFTLIEMLVVLVIIALIAALALPHIRGHTESVAIKAAANQLVSDLSYARQKAISQRSTVAVVFLTDAIFNAAQVNPALATLPDEKKAIDRLQGGVFTHYAVYSFRKAGEQPGRASAGYLTEWKALPEKTFLSTNSDAISRNISVETLEKTNFFPFPFSASANKPFLPYIAFDGDGRLTRLADKATGRGGPWQGDYASLCVARGAVFYGRDEQGVLTGAVEFQETPPFNGTNNIVLVDALSGRAKHEETPLQ